MTLLIYDSIPLSKMSNNDMYNFCKISMTEKWHFSCNIKNQLHYKYYSKSLEQEIIKLSVGMTESPLSWLNDTSMNYLTSPLTSNNVLLTSANKILMAVLGKAIVTIQIQSELNFLSNNGVEINFDDGSVRFDQENFI